MRVGLVCPYSLSKPGGVQTHVLGLASWLKSEGHQVSVLAPGGKLNRNQLEYFCLDQAEIADAGESVDYSFNGSTAPVSFGMKTFFRTRKWLQHHRFEVIHVHEPLVPGPSLYALGLARVPVVATFHTDAQDSTAFRMLLRRIPRVAAKIAVPIAVSQTAARLATARLGVAPRVIPNAIPAIRKQPNGESVAHTAVFIGRFDEPRKGFEVLLEAVPLVRETIADFQCVVIGPGIPRATPGVEYLGPADDATRDEWLSRAALLIAPSLGQESFGIVLIEAMNLGAGVVACDIPGYAAVLDGRGILVPPGDPAALAAGILRGLTEPADRQEIQNYAARFTWPVAGQKVLQSYRIATSDAIDYSSPRM